MDSEGALIDSNGIPSPVVYAIGPARKGCLWETIAVPEIRTQAAQLADHLALMLERQAELNRTAGAMVPDLIGQMSR